MTARTGRRSSCTVDVGISLIEDLAISVDAFSRVVLPDHASKLQPVVKHTDSECSCCLGLG